MLTLSNPASRIARRASRASRELCSLPVPLRMPSSKDWTPRLIRFTPPSFIARSFALPSPPRIVVGSVSQVIWRQFPRSKSSAIPRRNLSVWAGESIEGVPPPTRMDVGAMTGPPRRSL